MKSTTKIDLLQAFDQSEKQTIGDVCRIADVMPSTYYFHFYKDAAFRRQVLVKKMDYLAAKIAAEPTSEGENI
jgi:hypothetical protein